MKFVWSKRRITFAIVLLFSLFIVFFVEWSFDKSESSRNLSLTANWITSFRRGLDVSWWTKLTYKISFDKYKNIYTNASEFNAVKQNVQNILLQNIDGRISKLWVSDYNAYIQERDEETQLVVEIWWITDLDQAKEIIGKTVELEFKLPNPNETNVEERKTLANKMYQEVKDNPTKMQEIAWSRESENVYYSYFDHQPLSALPSFYTKNSTILTDTRDGEMSNLKEWTYDAQKYYDENGQIQSQDINWYLFLNMISKETVSRENPWLSDLYSVSQKLGLHIDENLEIANNDNGIGSGQYSIKDHQLKYNNGSIFDNQEAYKVRIFSYVPEDVSWLTGDEYTKALSKIEDRKKFVIKELENEPRAEFNDVKFEMETTLSLLEMKKSISSFVGQDKWKAQAYDVDWVIYFVVVLDKKLITDTWYGFVVVHGVDKETFEKEIKSETYYTFEEVFVQDKLTWIPAQSSNGSILNGANFQYASVGSSELWQPAVKIMFDSIGKSIFGDITEHNIGKQMAIFIWGKLITSPNIKQKIEGGVAIIEGGFTVDEAKNMATSLNEWALPATLILMQEENMEPSLGDRAFVGSVWALCIGIIAITIYMMILYGFKKWMVTFFSILSYTVVLLAVVKITDYALSLSGIAAIILSIGMAVDANVLIFERMKEEISAWKTETSAINIAYDRSFTAIKDSHISTWIIGFFLFWIGINIFKGFGLMLVVGVLLTLLINVPLIKEYIMLFHNSKSDTNLKKGN